MKKDSLLSTGPPSPSMAVLTSVKDRTPQADIISFAKRVMLSLRFFRFGFVLSPLTILLLVVSRSAAAAAATTFLEDDFSSQSSLWESSYTESGAGSLVLRDGLLNYVTVGVPSVVDGAVQVWKGAALKATEPWIVEVSLAIGDPNKRADVRLVLQSIDNPKNELYLHLLSHPIDGHRIVSAYTLLDWTQAEAGNQKAADAAHLGFQFAFDPTTKAVIASLAESSTTNAGVFVPLYKVGLSAANTDWKLNDLSQFRFRLEAHSFESSYVGPGDIGFDRCAVTISPGPRTNEVSLDGTKPFATIQAAIDSSHSGDSVLVYPGEYRENINLQSKDILISSLFGRTADPAFVTNTVINGGANGSPAVTLAAREMAARLVGFTITNGVAAGRAGAIQIERASVATIEHCRFLGNQNALVVRGTNLPSTLRWCSFTRNTGPVIALQEAPLRVQQCTFVENGAYPGAVIDWEVYGGLLEIERCLFVGNTAPQVLAVPRHVAPWPASSDHVRVVNCTFYSNQVTSATITTAGSAIVLNSILLDNGPMQVLGGALTLDYNLIAGGANAVRAGSAAQLTYGVNISDPALLPTFEGTPGIPAADSAAIGGGKALWSAPGQPTLATPAVDLLGRTAPDPTNSAPDIGAIELPYGGPLSFLKSPSAAVGRLGQPLTVKLQANNQPLTFAYSGLPAGFEGNPDTGAITGVPTELGTNLVAVTIQNQWGISTNQLALAVLKAIPDLRWEPPATVVWGRPLDTQIIYGATVITPLPGEFSYDPPLGAVLEPGTRTVRITFVPFDTNRFELVVLTHQVTVQKADQQLEFNPPSFLVLGDGPVALKAVSTAALPVRFEIVTGPATLAGDFLEPNAGGVITIRAVQPGDAHYAAAPPVARSIPVHLRAVVTHNAGGTVLQEPNSDSVPFGSALSLTAIASDGFSFDAWSGDLSSKANPLTVNVTNNIRIAAVFTPRWRLVLTNTPGGAVVSEPPAGSLVSGSHVIVNAIPAQGFGLYAWTGSFNTQTNPLDFWLTTNIDLTAVFKQVFAVTVQTNLGGSVTVSPVRPVYFDGDILQLSAQALEGYRFENWQADLKGQTGPALMVTLTNTLRIAAAFRPLQTVPLSHTGQGEVIPVNGLFHDLGESITVRADAAKGWGFAGWSGSAAGLENPITVPVTTNTALTAVFKPLWTLAVRATAGGAVEVAPNQAEYLEGTALTLTPLPKPFYRFAGWTGAVVSTNAPLEFSIRTNSVIEAAFEPAHWLSLNKTVDISQGAWLGLHGLDNLPYVIEVSSGLEFWTPLATVTNRVGQSEYLDTQASGLSRRFYRLRTGP